MILYEKGLSRSHLAMEKYWVKQTKVGTVTSVFQLSAENFFIIAVNINNHQILDFIMF